MTTAAFFRSGSETPFVQGVKSAKYPYTVKPNPDEAAPTLTEAELRLTSSQMDSLKDRVKVDPKNPNVEIVDKFFRLERNANKEALTLALKTWGDLQWKCKAIGFGSGFVAVSLTFIALHGAPVYITVAFYVGILALTCLAGWSLNRYHIADKELAVWQRPGEDFAQKRRAALELSLQEMIQKKCHFHPEQPTGTLFAVEILSVFRRDFKQFATPLLERKCNTPEEEHRWVLDFFNGNPLRIKFFVDNPHLALEAEWKDVQKFQTQFDQLVKVMKHIEESYVAEFPKRKEAVKQKHEPIQKAFEEKTQAYSKAQKILPLNANNYFQRVLKVLKAECLDPILAIHKRDCEKVNSFGSLIYPQVKALLEQANKGLLLDQKDYELDPATFADPAKFVPGNFQKDLDAVTANFPQNVIDKAKAEAPKEERQEYRNAYFRFIDAAFSP